MNYIAKTMICLLFANLQPINKHAKNLIFVTLGKPVAVTLTDAYIKRIKPPASGKAEIRDSTTTGLSLRTTAKGVHSWNFVYRLGGKQRRMTIGHYPEISLLQARAIARKAREDIAFGIDPIAQREEAIIKQIVEDEAGITVQALWDDYNVKYVQVRHRRAKYTEQTFKKHILPYFGNTPARDVKRKDVVKRLDEIKASGHPHAANHMLVAFRKMYNWALERDEVEVNPCLNISKPVKVQERERVLNKSEIKKLWEICDEIGYPYGPLIKLLLLTCQRRNEISTLKWKYINMEERVIRLPAENVKANRSHDIPLSEMAIQILNEIPRFKAPYVFSSTHGKKAVNSFGKIKIHLDALAKFQEPWRLHDIRRTGATCMAEIGIPLHTISRVLNHSEGGVTKIYARHSYLQEKREALNKWSSHLSSIVNNPDGMAANVVELQKVG